MAFGLQSPPQVVIHVFQDIRVMLEFKPNVLMELTLEEVYLRVQLVHQVIFVRWGVFRLQSAPQVLIALQEVQHRLLTRIVSLRYIK